MSTKLPYPEFTSEAEEADWLFEHREELDDYFRPMTGAVRNMLLRDHELILPDAFLAVPLSADDLARANAIAAAQGIDPAEYVGRIVHEALHAKRAA